MKSSNFHLLSVEVCRSNSQLTVDKNNMMFFSGRYRIEHAIIQYIINFISRAHTDMSMFYEVTIFLLYHTAMTNVIPIMSSG